VKLYRVEMVLSATLYVKADDAVQALEKAKKLHGKRLTLEGTKDVAVSIAEFDSLKLPEQSFTPIAWISGPDPKFEPDVVYEG